MTLPAPQPSSLPKHEQLVVCFFQRPAAISLSVWSPALGEDLFLPTVQAPVCLCDPNILVVCTLLVTLL